MKKLAFIGALAVMMMTSCSSLKVVDQNAAANAGAAALQALTISDATGVFPNSCSFEGGTKCISWFSSGFPCV